MQKKYLVGDNEAQLKLRELAIVLADSPQEATEKYIKKTLHRVESQSIQERKSFSYIKQLARIAFPFSNKDKYMLMLEVYFDETGHGDDPNIQLFGMVGCLAKAERWADFEVEWNAVLKAEGLDYFHMNEFAHSKKAFKDWKDDKQRRDRLEADLWKVIHKTNPVLVGCFVDLEGYRGQFGEVFRNTVGDVYHLCFLHFLKFISTIVRNNAARNDFITNVATIFDDKKKVAGRVWQTYEHIMSRFPELQRTIPRPIFRDMRDVSPIQVADIFAYEAQKEFKEQAKQVKGADRAKKRPGYEHLENLYLGQTNKNDYPFGDINSQFAFYSQQELVKITMEYNREFGNGKLL